MLFGGVEALGNLPSLGAPAVHDGTSIIAVTLEPPPDKLGVTHWSARLLADHLGISFATVARIWRRWGLQPWKAETLKFSTGPELKAKIRDVVGPPEPACAVRCCCSSGGERPPPARLSQQASEAEGSLIREVPGGWEQP